MFNYRRFLLFLLSFAALSCASCTASNAVTLPPPVSDAKTVKGEQSIVFAGGCFWGIQSVFEHVSGVKSVTAGYAGGGPETADYETVSTGRTGHAESVKVVYDPAKVTFGNLLMVFFSVAHDPTQLNRQSQDIGTQYRSEIFATTNEQLEVAKQYIAQLNSSKSFSAPVVTKVSALHEFYPAEGYHQHYAELHPYDPYIIINDAPKVAALRKVFPQLYRAR
jgi:peptide-methionine (S)-S-oxide reductase